MKKFKTIYHIVTVIVLISLTVSMFVHTSAEQQSGDLNSNLPVTFDDREWIYKTFGHNKDFESLISDIVHFGLEHFVYDDLHDHQLPLQSFNFTRFRTKEKCDFHGVCFHFTCFTKIVVETIFPEVDSYIVDVRLNGRRDKAHSYNYFIYNGNTYMVDITVILTRYNKNLNYEDYAKNIGKISYRDYAVNVFNDEIYRVY